LHYQFDVMATVLEECGAIVPEHWDGRPFGLDDLTSDTDGRHHLVLSQASWTAQRSVRFEQWLCIRTYHDAFHGYPDIQLFDVESDPHEQTDLAGVHPQVVDIGLHILDEWAEDALSARPGATDPMWTVLAEDGPWHSRVDVDRYLKRLATTGRTKWADTFAIRDSPFETRCDGAMKTPLTVTTERPA
jgi:choline-sulfatase